MTIDTDQIYYCVTQTVTYHSLPLLQWTKVLCTPELEHPQLCERERKEGEKGGRRRKERKEGEKGGRGRRERKEGEEGGRGEERKKR